MSAAERELYLVIKRNDDVYYIWADFTSKGREVKRELARYTGQRICDMRLVIPRLNNAVFDDNRTVSQEMLENGDKLLVFYRNPQTGKFEGDLDPNALFGSSSDDSYDSL